MSSPERNNHGRDVFRELRHFSARGFARGRALSTRPISAPAAETSNVICRAYLSAEQSTNSTCRSRRLGLAPWRLGCPGDEGGFRRLSIAHHRRALRDQ